jgi:5-methylcytosine-specific restriction endonuclease McrA
MQGEAGREVACWDSRALYRTSLWTRTRRLILARDPICAVDPRCGRPSTHADHIISAIELARRGRLDLFFSLDNLRGACGSCNSRQAAIETNARRRGRRRPPRRRRFTSAEALAVAWAEREDAYWRSVEERERCTPQPQARRTPRIY